MTILKNSLLMLLAVGLLIPTLWAQSEDLIPASDGGIQVTAINHASVQLEHNGLVIHVDPWSQGDYSNAKQADLILVTDIHGDHLDPDAIAMIRKPGAPIVAPAAASPKLENATIVANGEKVTVAGVSIEAVPAYNLERGPEPGQLFHTKGRGNGYVVTLGGTNVYFSGDTECVPEIRSLTNVQAAFITMNLPYTMPPSEAASCVRDFQPQIVYPYHHRGAEGAPVSDLNEFTSALMGQPVEVRILDWYPN